MKLIWNWVLAAPYTWHSTSGPAYMAQSLVHVICWALQVYAFRSTVHHIKHSSFFLPMKQGERKRDSAEREGEHLKTQVGECKPQPVSLDWDPSSDTNSLWIPPTSISLSVNEDNNSAWCFDVRIKEVDTHEVHSLKTGDRLLRKCQLLSKYLSAQVKSS